MTETDKMLYEKANAYRLHADHLKWTLLGGYGAFFAAVMLQLKDNGVQPTLQTALVFLALFSVSIFYLFILAVQSWYYNLFGAYVENCEEKLLNGQKLESLKVFTDRVKGNITPLHFAFSFALYIVAFTSLGFLLPVFQYVLYVMHVDFQKNILPILGIAILWLILYLGTFQVLFRNWNRYAFPLISFLSGDKGSDKQKKRNRKLE